MAGLSSTTDDAVLLKFFARYGKVQEAHVVRNDSGGSRGFGFVTFVSTKGSNFCIAQVGEAGVSIDGRDCNVRFAHDGPPPARHKMPARGSLAHHPWQSSSVAGATRVVILGDV